MMVIIVGVSVSATQLPNPAGRKCARSSKEFAKIVAKNGQNLNVLS
jgi:hypothetical protein